MPERGLKHSSSDRQVVYRKKKGRRASKQPRSSCYETSVSTSPPPDITGRAASSTEGWLYWTRYTVVTVWQWVVEIGTTVLTRVVGILFTVNEDKTRPKLTEGERNDQHSLSPTSSVVSTTVQDSNVCQKNIIAATSQTDPNSLVPSLSSTVSSLPQIATVADVLSVNSNTMVSDPSSVNEGSLSQYHESSGSQVCEAVKGFNNIQAEMMRAIQDAKESTSVLADKTTKNNLSATSQEPVKLICNVVNDTLIQNKPSAINASVTLIQKDEMPSNIKSDRKASYGSEIEQMIEDNIESSLSNIEQFNDTHTEQTTGSNECGVHKLDLIFLDNCDPIEIGNISYTRRAFSPDVTFPHDLTPPLTPLSLTLPMTPTDEIIDSKTLEKPTENTSQFTTESNKLIQAIVDLSQNENKSENFKKSMSLDIKKCTPESGIDMQLEKPTSVSLKNSNCLDNVTRGSKLFHSSSLPATPDTAKIFHSNNVSTPDTPTTIQFKVSSEICDIKDIGDNLYQNKKEKRKSKDLSLIDNLSNEKEKVAVTKVKSQIKKNKNFGSYEFGVETLVDERTDLNKSLGDITKIQPKLNYMGKTDDKSFSKLDHKKSVSSDSILSDNVVPPAPKIDITSLKSEIFALKEDIMARKGRVAEEAARKEAKTLNEKKEDKFYVSSVEDITCLRDEIAALKNDFLSLLDDNSKNKLKEVCKNSKKKAKTANALKFQLKSVSSDCLDGINNEQGVLERNSSLSFIPTMGEDNKVTKRKNLNNSNIRPKSDVILDKNVVHKIGSENTKNDSNVKNNQTSHKASKNKESVTKPSNKYLPSKSSSQPQLSIDSFESACDFPPIKECLELETSEIVSNIKSKQSSLDKIDKINNTKTKAVSSSTNIMTTNTTTTTTSSTITNSEEYNYYFSKYTPNSATMIPTTCNHHKFNSSAFVWYKRLKFASTSDISDSEYHSAEDEEATSDYEEGTDSSSLSSDEDNLSPINISSLSIEEKIMYGIEKPPFKIHRPRRLVMEIFISSFLLSYSNVMKNIIYVYD